MVLSLMAKPMPVTLPAVLLLLDFWPLCRSGSASLARLIWEKVPLLAVAVGFSIVAILAQQNAGALPSLGQLPFEARLKNAALSYLVYLGRTVYPANLAAHYPHPENRLLPWAAAAAALVVFAVTVAVLRGTRRLPFLFVGWFWFLVTLGPVIGLVQVGRHAQANRYAYVPLVGLFIGIAWLLAGLARRWRAPGYLAGLPLASVAGLMAASWIQVQTWHDSAALWQQALQATGGSAVAHNNMGLVLIERGNLTGAVYHYLEALELDPTFAPAHLNLGLALKQQGDVTGALRHYQEAVRLEPKEPTAWTNLGALFLAQGKFEESRRSLEEAICLAPDNADAHLNLGATWLGQGQPEKAVRHLQEAARLNPDLAEAPGNLGLAEEMLEDWPGAVACFQSAVARAPRRADYHRELAFALHHEGRTLEADREYQEAHHLDPLWRKAATREAWTLAHQPNPTPRNGVRALRLAQQVDQATAGRDPRALAALAAAAAATGDFAAAAAAARRGQAQAAAAGEATLAAELGQQVRQYEKRQP
jgi:tetratricopeptide (TPR) repeat protein